MRRLLNIGHWPWTDHRPSWPRGVLFLASGECVTTLFLACYAVVFANPDSTFSTSVAFSWIRSITAGAYHGEAWAAISVALALTGPVALWENSGVLRMLSLVSQGIFFLLLANSVRMGAPASLLFATLLISGSWLILRAVSLAWHFWRLGGGGVRHRG